MQGVSTSTQYKQRAISSTITNFHSYPFGHKVVRSCFVRVRQNSTSSRMISVHGLKNSIHELQWCAGAHKSNPNCLILDLWHISLAAGGVYVGYNSVVMKRDYYASRGELASRKGDDIFAFKTHRSPRFTRRSVLLFYL